MSAAPASPPHPQAPAIATQARRLDATGWVVREVEPSDKPALRTLYRELSDDSRHDRVLALVSPSERALDDFCGPDHERWEGFVAVATGGSTSASIVGHVCIDAEQAAGSREVALVVADQWQGRGIGTALLDEAMRWARERSIARLSASILAANGRGCRMLERAGWRGSPIPGSPELLRFVFELSADCEATPR